MMKSAFMRAIAPMFVLSLASCAAMDGEGEFTPAEEEVDAVDLEASPQSEADVPLGEEAFLGLDLDILAAGDACISPFECPAQFDECYWIYDRDCEAPFCRDTDQCGGEGTFSRVDHVYVCYDDEENPCVEYIRGRRLIECGCD